MDEAVRERRRRWIAWSMRPELRPLAFAAVAKGRGGGPPPVPASTADLSVDFPFRSSDRRWLMCREPDVAAAARLEAAIRASGDFILTPEEGGWLAKLWNELEDPPPALADWFTFVLQPDPGLPADGEYDALALVDDPSLVNAFSLTFVWLGGATHGPGSQPFLANEFDDLGNFTGVIGSGRTIPGGVIPEPGTMLLVACGLAALAAAARKRT